MLSAILGTLITAVTTLLGKRLADEYVKKAEFYKGFSAFNDYLLANLSFKREDVLSVAANYKTEGEFGKFLRQCDLKSGEINFPIYVKGDECVLVREYFSGVGRRFNDAETEYLKSFRQIIGEKCEETAIKAAKAKPLGVKLGFSAGIIIFILII